MIYCSKCGLIKNEKMRFYKQLDSKERILCEDCNETERRALIDTIMREGRALGFKDTGKY
jgi:hypothetical protein